MITIPLDPDKGQPLYLQIYEYIKQEILTGQLKAKEKLPSSRSLAANLQVSRSTVDTAYDQLVAEGYVEAEEKKGYFVTSITYLQHFEQRPSAPSPIQRKEKKVNAVRYDFNPHAIDITHFPFSIWKSIGKNQLDNPDNYIAGDGLGDYPLREAIASYLHGARGVHCLPEQVIVGAGLDHLLQMLCVLFPHRYTIAMEDPGYRSARQVFITNGYKITDIPLQDLGIDTSLLQASQADICYVTPSHQFPMGSIMTIAKRHKLLAWADESPDRYIIEDDHDSEFRYKGNPIPSLQSLDANNKVIYIGTFSKAISSAIRMGYMVLPEPLLQKYQKRCGNYSCPVSRIQQAILTDFIQGGYFEKHLNRMRKIYKTRHDKMVQTLQEILPPHLFEIFGDHAGLYVLLRYKGNKSEQAIEKRAEKNGIRLRSLKGYYASLPADYQPTYLLGFANLSDEDIVNGIRCLFTCFI